MEEIIASISRIIAEDGGGREPSLPAAAAEDDILELTEALGEDGKVQRIEPTGEHRGGSNPAPQGPAAPLEPQLPQSAPGVTEGPAEAPATAGRPRLLSPAGSAAAAAAFAGLGALPPGAAAEGAGRTIEDIVREVLRPLLQAWLDEHLPAIVERLVREEIARVAGEAGLR